MVIISYKFFLIPFKNLIIILIITLLTSCLGKTSNRSIYFISPKKKVVYINLPINYTTEFELSKKIQKEFQEYFEKTSRRFSYSEKIEDSQLYLLLYIHEYTIKRIDDYGYANTKLSMKVNLLLSDPRKTDKKDEESRFYFKDFPITIDLFEKVISGDALYTLENAKRKWHEKLVTTISYLMETGKLYQ